MMSVVVYAALAFYAFPGIIRESLMLSRAETSETSISDGESCIKLRMSESRIAFYGTHATVFRDLNRQDRGGRGRSGAARPRSG